MHFDTPLWSAPLADPVINPTGVAAGIPGHFTGPASFTVPQTLADVRAVTGVPVDRHAWPINSYVALGDGSHAYWNGYVWMAGEAPELASFGETQVNRSAANVATIHVNVPAKSAWEIDWGDGYTTTKTDFNSGTSPLSVELTHTYIDRAATYTAGVRRWSGADHTPPIPFDDTVTILPPILVTHDVLVYDSKAGTFVAADALVFDGAKGTFVDAEVDMHQVRGLHQGDLVIRDVLTASAWLAAGIAVGVTIAAATVVWGAVAIIAEAAEA